MTETIHKLKKEIRQRNLTKKSLQKQKNTIIIDTKTVQNTSKDNKNKQFIALNLASLPLVDPSITETQVTTEKQSQIKIVQKELWQNDYKEYQKLLQKFYKNNR